MNHTVSKIPSFWNDERVAKLVRLWNEGMSTPKIARLIPGSTKNGVIGKAHRLNLKPRPSPIPVKKPPALFHPHTCEWPHGDPKQDGFHFCGAKPVPGRPYCGKHCKLAYRRVGAAVWTDDRREQHRALMLRWHEKKRMERHP